MNDKKTGLILVFGGVGGAINAALAFVRLPVPVGDVTFEWHVILAGAAHGAILAGTAAASAFALQAQALPLRWIAAPVVGWLAGWLSWVPMHLSIVDMGLMAALRWPFVDSFGDVLISPLRSFGLVSALLYGGLNLSVWPLSSRGVCVIMGITSGVLGSLWFWASVGPWYLALLHGGIWGGLVGRGLYAESPQKS